MIRVNSESGRFACLVVDVDGEDVVARATSGVVDYDMEGLEMHNSASVTVPTSASGELLLRRLLDITSYVSGKVNLGKEMIVMSDVLHVKSFRFQTDVHDEYMTVSSTGVTALLHESCSVEFEMKDFCGSAGAVALLFKMFDSLCQKTIFEEFNAD